MCIMVFFSSRLCQAIQSLTSVFILWHSQTERMLEASKQCLATVNRVSGIERKWKKWYTYLIKQSPFISFSNLYTLYEGSVFLIEKKNNLWFQLTSTDAATLLSRFPGLLFYCYLGHSRCPMSWKQKQAKASALTWVQYLPYDTNAPSVSEKLWLF